MAVCELYDTNVWECPVLTRLVQQASVGGQLAAQPGVFELVSIQKKDGSNMHSTFRPAHTSAHMQLQLSHARCSRAVKSSRGIAG
jgi:hypothetical protein